MSKSLNTFRIPFVGLKSGVHTFEYKVDKTFFDALEYSLIHDGDVHVTLNLEKKETMMVAEFDIHGPVFTLCDRCNDPLEVEIDGNYRIVYKFGDEPSDDESLIVLPDETYELDIVPQLYELISVSLPARCVHDQGECNEEVMALYKQHVVNPGDPEDEDDDDWYDDEDEDYDDDDEDWSEEDDEDETPDDPDRPIDPRWSALKNLN